MPTNVLYTPQDLSAAPATPLPDRSIHTGGRRTVQVMNRSPFWLQILDPSRQIIKLVPAWFESVFSVDQNFKSVTAAVYTGLNVSNNIDFNTNLPQIVTYDADCEAATPADTPLVLPVVSNQGSPGVSYHDSHSGAKAATGVDTSLGLDKGSTTSVAIWNRDATTDLYVNFNGAVTTKGGTDLHLKPGEFYSASINVTAINYQGGAAEFQIWV